ncbi:outer membrane protein transport protein [Motilimonas pumila]|uniref:Aromatic hydrocarbon degradation protein n=1 Tax=Motilimonas pumila TaxID=2303987 RepID=A0A418YAP2_9GAMM|nr:outer membrane protein transport protein [Motilimonas pumila]RJG40047.1 aromatic hydrocarbon degradation protein [Motilimonas pumila]
MTIQPAFRKTLVAIALASVSGTSLAAGFQLNAQSASGLGRAFAGDAVIADNASVMAKNPAAMALFDEMSLSLGFVMLDTDIEVKDTTYTTPFGVTTSNYGDAGDVSFAPNIHFIMPINEQFAWGANLYSNFGTKTEFDDSFTASEYGGLTDVKSMNLGLAGSYRINQAWSIGAGIDFIYGKGEMKRNFTTPMGSQEVLNIDADGWAVGFNLGVVYELDDANRFGLSYRYSPKLEAEGDILYAGSAAAGKPPLAKDDTLYMPLPDIIEFSGYHRLNQEFAVHYSVQWIGWSSFDVLKSDAHGVLNDYQWQNGMHYAIGGTYYVNKDWTLRAGYMHDTSAQDQITSISVPDSDRNWFSAGASYHFATSSTVDFGVTYLSGKDVSVEEEFAGITHLKGKTRANAWLVGLQYSQGF